MFKIFRSSQAKREFEEMAYDQWRQRCRLLQKAKRMRECYLGLYPEQLEEKNCDILSIYGLFISRFILCAARMQKIVDEEAAHQA